MARKRLDKILVADVESTCWEGLPPAGEENEIIEIGICLLDVANGERGDRTSLLVHPDRSRVSRFCTSLTTLTQEQVDMGLSFSDACRILAHQYDSPNRLWASYGDYDRQMFDHQCRQRGVPYPFGKGHVNVKSLFAVAGGFRKEMGLASALEHLGMSFEGVHHRGSDDAWNIAAILWCILQSARAGLPGKGSI